jgi:hypothetical protein
MKELYVDSRYAKGVPTSIQINGSGNAFTCATTQGMFPNEKCTIDSNIYQFYQVISPTEFQVADPTTGSIISIPGTSLITFEAQAPNSYTLFLQRPIKNVAMAQVIALTVNPLSSITVPPNQNIRRGDFIFLDIAELRRPFPLDCKTSPDSAQFQISTSFAAIQLRELCSTTSGNFYMDKKDNAMVEYTKPIDSIDRLTIRWLDYQGNPVPMGSYNVFTLRLHESADERETDGDIPRPEEIDAYIAEVKKRLDESDPPVKKDEKRRFGRWSVLAAIIGIIIFWYIKKRSV